LTPDEDKDIEMIDHPNDKSPKSEANSSEATLIELDMDLDQPPPYDTTQGDRLFPTVEKGDSVDDTVMVNGDHMKVASEYPAPPDKPPPVPPRNKAGLSIQTKDPKDVSLSADPDTEEDGLWQFGTQQDVTEVMGNVMTLLSCAIKPTGVTEEGIQTDKVYDSFYGDSAVYTQKPRKLEKKVESWANLMVYPDDKKSRDIYEALDVNYDEQLVEIGNNQIPQYTSITKLPPILQIQIQRTAWNRGTGAGSKNSNPVVFPETIYLDRYMDSEDPESPLMKRRRQAWKWKCQLRSFEARQAALQTTVAELSVPDALLEVKRFIETVQEKNIQGIEIDPTVTDLLESRMEEVAHELELISHQVGVLKGKLNDQFATMRKYEYKLQTVFIHRGEAGGGHYWIYLYDFENDIWREYNDEHVTVVNDRRRIFEHQGGGTPYYLAYVRSADQKDLVNALFRDVREPEMRDVATSWADQLDEGIAMEEDTDRDVRHVENVNPRPILPKPAEGHWAASGASAFDSNGKPW
jgi:ubiquitin carboxyl-terminal hydrolase 25/28